MTVTPAVGAASQIAIGGTAVTAIAANPAGINGALIVNPLYAADQGIANAENLYLDPTGGTPGSTPGAGNGTVVTLVPGQSFSGIPGQITAIVVNAASVGHRFTSIVW
jgi:hypothetical protein